MGKWARNEFKTEEEKASRWLVWYPQVPEKTAPARKLCQQNRKAGEGAGSTGAPAALGRPRRSLAASFAL